MLDGTLATTNTLIAILTVVSVVEAIALGIALALATRWARRAAEAVRVVHEELRPLAHRVGSVATAAEGTLAEMHSLAAVATSGARSAGHALRAVADVAGAARSVTAMGTLPAIGIAVGLRTAYRAFRRSGKGRRVDEVRPSAPSAPERHDTVTKG